MRLVWLVLLTILRCGSALAGEFSGPVVSVLDGDTIDVLHNGQSERIRLNGIDAPEKGQPYGKRAKRFLADLVAGRMVTIQSHKFDRHKRTVGDVLLADGTDASQELVRAGLAWWYKQYSKDESLGVLEAEAREAKRGLRAEPDPIPPWVYRHPERTTEEGLSASTAKGLFALPQPTPQAGVAKPRTP